MDFGLRDKIVLVTGAARGIGKAIALAYGREGACVEVTYAHDRSAASDVVGEIVSAGGDAHAVHLELTDLASIACAIDTTVERFGGLAVLVANAVRWPEGVRGPLAGVGPEPWAQAVRANLEGTAATLRSAMVHLARGANPG